MEYAYITFWDDAEKPLKLTPEEYEKTMKVLSTQQVDFLIIKGNYIPRKSIKKIVPPPKPELVLIPERIKGKPISKERLDELKKRFAEKLHNNH